MPGQHQQTVNAPPPPELPQIDGMSDLLANYLRRFSAWSVKGFSHAVSTMTASPQVVLASTAGSDKTFALRVDDTPTPTLTMLKPGSGADGTVYPIGPTGGPFLPLSGGTLTGPLTGTTATFSGAVTGSNTPPLSVTAGSFVSVTMSAGQTMAPANTAVLLNFDTAEFDTDSEFVGATHLFTAKRAGYYRVNGSAICTNSGAAGNTFQIGVARNGTVIQWGMIGNSPAANTNTFSVVQIMLHLAINDTLSIYGFSSVASTPVGASTTSTRFQVQLLALG